MKKERERERVPSAAPTAMREGICNALTSESPLCEIKVLAHSTMTTKLTDPILYVGNEKREASVS